MGIRGLQSYVETKCPEACRRVSIAELVQEFRNGHPNCSNPVIAVDGMSCLQKIHGDLLWIMGGQWCEFMEKWSNLVSNFRQLGVELVFFFDGSTVTSKRERWVERRLRQVKDVQNIIDILNQTGSEPPISMFQLPAGMGLLTRYVLKYTLGCDVRTTIRECDEVVAEYAKNCPDCFALLGQDSDYLVYYDTAPYLSVSKLDLESLTTVIYDRHVVASHFGLPMSHLPLLACLRGNDIISEDELVPFHQWLCRGRRDEVRNAFKLLVKIAAYLRSVDLRVEDCVSESSVGQLRRLSKVVFDDESRVQLLVSALETYGMGRRQNCPPQLPVSASGHHPEVLRMARNKHENCENVPSVYSVLCGGEHDSSTPMEDDRSSSFPPSALLYRPVRQRTYSLLVGPIRRSYVNEWCVYAGNKLKHPDQVPVLPFRLPSGGSTSLEELWLRADAKLKYETFLCCFGTTFGVETLFTVSQHYYSPCCVINYLIQHTNIAEWEVDALLVHMFHPIGQNLASLKALRVPTLTVRCVELATLFLRGVTTVLLVLGVTSFPFRQEDAMPWLFFDGKLLAHCYSMVQNGTNIQQLCENPQSFNLFMSTQKVVKHGTRYQRLN